MFHLRKGSMKMRAFSLAMFVVLCSNMLLGQFSSMSGAPPADTATPFAPKLVQDLETLRDAALTSDYAYRQLAYLTENIGPRPTGSAQADAAAHYVADALRVVGLDAKLEEVVVPHWVRGAETAELVEWPGKTAGTTQKIVLTALGGSTATAANGLIAEVIVVRNFDELKALGKEKIAGKIVLFNEKFDVQKASAGHWGEAYGEAVQYRATGAKAAADLGAAAALVRSVGGADYRLPHTGYSAPAGIPAGAVTAEDAELMAHLAQQGVVRMHLTLTPQMLPDVTSYNVVADLKGSEHPEEVVIVSGHLDSWDLGTGAIDDGAGVVIAMGAVQLMKELHLQPKRTIRVIAWMNEETGSRGAKAYAKAHEGEVANHVAALESDLGAGHPMGFDAKVSAAAISALRPMGMVLSPIGANLMSASTDDVGADISPLAAAGVPTFGVMQDGRVYFNYHHTAADTLDKVAPRELRENVAAMAVLAFTLAEMPERLPK
jgi:carboxypeptidase Q